MASPDRVPPAPPLAGQAAGASSSSLYNLTLDDLAEDNAEGKPMMNLEEFLKTITSSAAAEDGEGNGEATTNHRDNHVSLLPPPLPSSSSSSSSSSIPPAYFVSNLNMNGAAPSLRKKAVDEVWKEIAHQREERFDDNLNQQPPSVVVQKQANLGETTTLEDFLVRAGLMNQQDFMVSPAPPPPSQPIMGMDPMADAAAAADWLQFQMCSAEELGQKMAVLDTHDQQQQFHHASDVGSRFGNSGVIGDSAENELVARAMSMAAVPAVVAAATSSDSQASVEKKRRVSDEMMEKTIERRQKRMIKNRESAARSRAKKQVCFMMHNCFKPFRTCFFFFLIIS